MMMRVVWASLLALFIAKSVFAAEPLTRFPPTDPARFRLELRDFALGRDGEVARGRVLFSDETRAGCAKCHSVDGSSSKAGPDLSSVGDKFPRGELIKAVLEPSAAIAVGYGTTVVQTKSGEEVQGVLKGATAEALDLVGADGKHVSIALADVQTQRSSQISLMPEGLADGMTVQEFSDLIGYLESLKQPEAAFASTQGMPARIPVASVAVDLQPFFGPNVKLNRPLWFGEVPGFTNRFIVLEHGGKSWLIEHGGEGDTQETFVDLSGRVRVGGATGLLGLAFHPGFAENRLYYLKYQIVEDGRISTLVAERLFSPGFRGDSGQEERLLLKIPAVTQDHNGGAIAFGPDGFLYVGTGDTGPQQDPQGHGQDMKLLLGKILRIDVDRQEGGRPYGIPATNPFRKTEGVLPEIWASGFREPWRFSFDRATGEFWVGDVGQDRIEEVSIVRSGENHGWNVFEGFTPFSNRYRRENTQYIPPVFAYPHRVGISITAGFVYRGQRAPSMQGRHICGDFESRRIWALSQTNRVLTSVVEIGRAPTRIASFAEDKSGELYLVGYDLGIIYRLNLASVDPTPLQTRVLADTSEREPVVWRYSLEAPAADWFRPEFSDGRWTNGLGGFGSAGTPGAVVRTDWRTQDIWLRRTFILATHGPIPSAQSLALRIHHDEDTEVYLNGVEAARLPRWTSGYVEAPINPAAAAVLHTGTNVIAVHCHQNTGGQYIDVGLIQTVRPGSISSAKAAP